MKSLSASRYRIEIAGAWHVTVIGTYLLQVLLETHTLPVYMPKNRVQTAIFTIMMVLVMVYGMICYNITLEVGGLSNFVFLEALPELAFMGPIAFLLDMLVVSPIVSRRAVKVVGPHPQTPFAMVAAISALSVQLMCPLMSLAATLIIKRPANVDILATWIQTTVLNLPMAFFWQFFVAGPVVRGVFGALVGEKREAADSAMPAAPSSWATARSRSGRFLRCGAHGARHR